MARSSSPRRRLAADAPASCTPPPASTLIVNVKDKGALGDGQTDDTAAIQAAIDAIGGTKGTVLVPKGVYMIDAVDNRLHLKDDMTLELADGAVLKAIPNDSKKYSLLTISGVANVWVTGGTLEGERDQHKGKSGEWGYGLHINKGAKHITVSNLVSRKMWGDGFYVQDAEDVRFCGVTADANRRQGLSIIEADGLLVLNSVFKNTHGTRPAAGIDLEPDKGEQEIANVRIVGSKFLDNAGDGITVGGKKARIAKVEMIAQRVPQQSALRAGIRAEHRRFDLRQPAGQHSDRDRRRLQRLRGTNRCRGPAKRLRGSELRHRQGQKKKKKKPGAD